MGKGMSALREELRATIKRHESEISRLRKDAGPAMRGSELLFDALPVGARQALLGAAKVGAVRDILSLLERLNDEEDTDPLKNVRIIICPKCGNTTSS